ncbi:hypothetical protein CR513_40766, partial [Mucuna pruriens]
MLLLQEFNIRIRDKKGAENLFPLEASKLYKEKLKIDAKYYIWDDPYLWRFYNDQVIRWCISDVEIKSVLQFCHETSRGDHYGSTQMARKVLRRCIPDIKIKSVLQFCHVASRDGHYGSTRTA